MPYRASLLIATTKDVNLFYKSSQDSLLCVNQTHNRGSYNLMSHTGQSTCINRLQRENIENSYYLDSSPLLEHTHQFPQRSL